MILIGSTPNLEPQLHLLNDIGDTPQQVFLFGVQNLSIAMKARATDTLRKPQFKTYRRATYCLGQFSPNIVVQPEGFAYLMGIAAPTKPSVAASGTGITGTALCTITFVRKHPRSGRDLQESSPGPYTSVTLANQGRAWTGIPTSVDPGVTHVRGYVSMDGAQFRRAWEREIGVSSVTENVPTLSLGAILQFDRNPPPYFAFGEIYHDRLWGVDPNDPTRIWYSKQFEPESFTPLNNIKLLDGERITACHKHGDVLLIWARDATYALTGWGEADFTLRKINPTIGCISPYSVVDLYSRTIFATKEGIMGYDGGFHNLMEEVNTAWRSEYTANPMEYENSQAVIDEYRKIYKLLIPTVNAYYWCGHYENFVSGEDVQPSWTQDVRVRSDTCVGLLRRSNSVLDEVYTGSSDGFVRKENVDTNFDDDGDDFDMKMRIDFKHQLMDDPGGGIMDGKHFNTLWSYVESENNAWDLKVWGGDEFAQVDRDSTPDWTDTVAASAVVGRPRKTVHLHKPFKVVGRGLSVRVEASNPQAMAVRGYGGIYGPGTIAR